MKTCEGVQLYGSLVRMCLEENVFIGDLGYARKVFDEVLDRNPVSSTSWT